MKKVFRVWKFLQAVADSIKNDNGFAQSVASSLLNGGWIPECEGLTIEEVTRKGYLFNDSWFVDEVSD